MDTVRYLGRLSYWPPVRFATQTSVAGIVAFAVIYALGIREVSWGVFSALFAVQWSVDSTIAIAFGRVAGAAIGSFIGLACLLLIGIEGVRETGLSLGVAVLLMSFIAGLRPSLYYGLFAAAAMILDPGGGNVVENAVARALAISIGTAAGALSAVLVLPMPAHRSAEEHLGRVVRRCGDLLLENIEALTEKKEYDLTSIHQDIRSEIYLAQSSLSQSKYARRLDRRVHRSDPNTLMRAVQRLWHNFALIERVEEKQPPEAVVSELVSELRATAEGGRDYLHDLGYALENNQQAPSPGDVLARFARAARRLEDISSEKAAELHSRAEAERLQALSIVLLELSQNIEELVGMLKSDPEKRAESEEGART